jgi:hypothetical protein
MTFNHRRVLKVHDETETTTTARAEESDRRRRLSDDAGPSMVVEIAEGVPDYLNEANALVTAVRRLTGSALEDEWLEAV